MFDVVRSRVATVEARAVGCVCTRYGTRLAFAAYAFVFTYYGFLKLVPGVTTPVQANVGHFVSGLGLPSFAAAVGLPFSLGAVMAFIGLYEVAIGVLFLTRRLRLVAIPFLVHQFTTFLSLVVAPEHYFQPPFLSVAGVDVPWLFGPFAAYVLKNAIFVGGFLLLLGVELGREAPRRATNEE